MTTTESRPTEVGGSTDDLDHYVEHGYVIRRGVIPPDVVERARTALERSEASGLALKGTATAHKDADLDPALAAVAEAVAAGGRDLFVSSSNPEPAVTGVVLHAPRPHEPDARWEIQHAHTDQHHPTFINAEEKGNAFAFLTRVESHGGALCFSPGSPARIRSWQTRHSFESVFSRVRGHVLPGDGLVEGLVDAGDVIYYDNNMIHSTSVNVEGPTRYALRIGLIVPGRQQVSERPVDELSAIERASSVRYLRDRFGAEAFPLLEPGPCEAELENGFGPVVAHDLLRFDGRIHRFWVERDRPNVIRRATSVDLARWEPLSDLEFGPEPVVSLQAEYRHRPTLVVNTRTADGHSKVRWMESGTLGDDWTQLFWRDGATMSRPHWIIESTLDSTFAETARGEIVYVVNDDAPERIDWRAGDGREVLTLTWRSGSCHEASGPITDLIVRPQQVFTPVLIADVAGRAHYTVSGLADRFRTPLAPVTVDGEPDAAVSHIRLFERVERYWLLTYRDGDRIRWGEMEWRLAPGSIRPITTVDGLSRALGIIGLR